MAGLIAIESAGPGTTIQDEGRHGLLRFGVTPAGPMDWAALHTANLALGNAVGAAAIEVGPGGLTLTADSPLPIAFAGGGFAWTRGDAALPSAARIMVKPGERLRARSGAWGRFAICAVPGGIDIPEIMHSRSTHARSRLGGVEGRALAPGDRLRVGRPDADALDDVAIDARWLDRTDDPVRVILGPQDDYFSADTIAAFLRATFKLTATADRMAYKFAGPRIAHTQDFNIVSDGVALGAVQVAGDGQPLVLMADRQPTGGYTKIAHVCRADIGRLAQLRPGETCRFACIPANAARKALFALEDAVRTTPEHLLPLRRTPSIESLFAANLIDGVIDGRDDRT